MTHRRIDLWMAALAVAGAVMLGGSINWRSYFHQPWMTPAISVEVVDGEPLVSFLGVVHRAAVPGTYGADIHVEGEQICAGGGSANYQIHEPRPANKTIDWWITPNLAAYPGGCAAELVPGQIHRLTTTWCNPQGECHEATAVWKQPPLTDLQIPQSEPTQPPSTE